MILDIHEIAKILPHRFPFLLVDRVIDMEPGQKIVCIKNVTMNEPFFQGHFPNYPIMPGVLMIEAMAQAGAILALKSEKAAAGSLIVLAGVDNAKFRRPVFPGDQIKMVVTTLQKRPSFWKLKGECFVDEKLVVEAELKAMASRPETGEGTQ